MSPAYSNSCLRFLRAVAPHLPWLNSKGYTGSMAAIDRTSNVVCWLQSCSIAVDFETLLTHRLMSVQEPNQQDLEQDLEL